MPTYQLNYILWFHYTFMILNYHINNARFSLPCNNESQCTRNIVFMTSIQNSLFTLTPALLKICIKVCNARHIPRITEVYRFPIAHINNMNLACFCMLHYVNHGSHQTCASLHGTQPNITWKQNISYMPYTQSVRHEYTILEFYAADHTIIQCWCNFLGKIHCLLH